MRHWLVGNGKSLHDTPLHLLEGEISWGMNRIHTLFENTEWRPTHYFMCDHNQQNPRLYWHECILENIDAKKWLWSAFRDGIPANMANGTAEPGLGDLPNTTWIERCKKHHHYSAGNPKSMQEWHLPELCTGLGGMSTMLQLAVLEGATEIYLVGCDLYTWTGDYNDNFFDPDYTSDPRDRTEIDNAHMTQLHEVASRCAGIPVYNAGIGGKLEVYPRVDIYEVLK